MTVTDLFGPRFAVYDHANRITEEEQSAGHGLGGLAKVNGLLGGGKNYYLKGTNLYPSDLRTIEQNAPVIKLLAENEPEEAGKLYTSIHSRDADTDLGTSDPAKMALIQKINGAMDSLTAQEQPGARSLHFKAEGRNIAGHLDAGQSANVDTVLQSMSPDQLFGTGRVAYTKDAAGVGVLTIDDGISSNEIEQFSGPLKIAIDTGDAQKVKAFQKFKGLTDLNLQRKP